MASLFSIGYAAKSLDVFFAQLQEYQVSALVDVRSVPFSQYYKAYHQDSIQRALIQAGIHYVFLGDKLGPRSSEPSHYDEGGQVQFDRLMQSDSFKQGVLRLEKGLEKGFNIALMCAEKDPAVCHRSLLIGYFLRRHRDLNVVHILHEGGVERQCQLESRVTAEHGLAVDLFSSEAQINKCAYQQRLIQTSYRQL